MLKMNLDYCRTQLSTNAISIQHLVDGIEGEQARWKPNPDSWSVLEVINHLYDEEREDFRARIRHILSGATGDAPPINPVGWVTERGYNQRNLRPSVENFLRERQESLDWLKGLGEADWDAAYVAPWGSIRAGDFLVAWVAHDILHLRQLVELKWAYSQTQFSPYDPHYAGEW